MGVTLDRRLLTVEEYHLMAEVGILTEEDRVELIRGEIITMSPIGSKHSVYVKKINRLLILLVQDRAIVSVQDPIYLDTNSEPEPDLALIHPPLDRYLEHHPRPEEVFIVIEVADSSIRKDREVKLPMYAEAGIPEYWIVDLEQQQIEVYKSPSGRDYSSKEIMKKGDSMYLQSIDLSLNVDQILI